MTKSTIKDYYQTEMQLLNEAAAVFAKTHPHEAARLNMDSVYDGDPHIAILLEGSAYLNARVKQQIDFGLGHISEALIRQLAPQYITPYPSMTVVQFSSLDQRIADIREIPAGVKLRSAPVGEEQTECEFSTTRAVDILPLQLTACRSEQLSADSSSLRLSFQFNEGLDPAAIKGLKIPLFINSTPDVACVWQDFLSNKVRDVTIRGPNESAYSIGAQQRLTAMHFHYHDTMLPQLSRHIKAFELLTDYFLFQEKYWFLQLDLSSIAFKETVFELNIEFSEPLTDLRLHSDLFKLHCVPAVNLFKTTAEPIRYRDNQSQYPLTVAHGQSNSKQLLAIVQVSGFKRQSSEAITLVDFYQQTNWMSKHGHYRLSDLMMKEDECQYALSFSGSDMQDMHISCELLAFNVHYPRHFLYPGSLKLSDERIPALVAATNLIRPSRYHRNELTQNYVARVLSLVNARLESFANLEHFKQMLQLHDWAAKHRAQIQAIESVAFKPWNRLKKGVVVRALVFDLTIADAGFSSFSQLQLFARVLHHFICYFAPLNTQVQTQIETFPSARQIQWVNHD